ncbi:MAG: DUF4261 domain-containing protein [Lachnospiraceae bacterium]|nr:DUF4261 domain-containing protein [Lachnospiraceae bacterium]
MGLFSKNKPSSPNKPEDSRRQEAKERLKQFDPAVRPGGVFMVKLLMKEQCAMPSPERIREIMSRHLGRIEGFDEAKKEKGFFAGFALDYVSRFSDREVPVQLAIMGCDAFDADKIDEMQRSQMWDCQQDRDRILAECKYAVLANDMLGGGLPSRVRANMLMDYVEALLELFPSCEAVYFINTGKLLLADMLRKGEVRGLNRYIKYYVNVRYFNIDGTNDHVIDTMGLSLLYIEDLQYHFHDMDPNWVVNHAYNMASYILDNDRPIKDGDTINGMAEGRLVQDIQWKCHFENSLIAPQRSVLDVCMGEYAAGNRQYT